MTRRADKANGRVSVLLVVTLLCLLALWAVIWLAILAATGQFRNLYAQVRVSPRDVLWLQFKRNRMRTAPTLEMLENAKRTGPEHSGWGSTEFPPVDVPVGDATLQKEWSEAQLYLTLHGSRCEADWRLRRTDDAGAKWEFQVSDELELSRSPGNAPVNDVPRVARPMLEVDAQPGEEAGGHTVEVALTFSTEQGDFLDVARNGRKVDALVRVLDSEGKVVASKKAPLKEFGYT